MDTTIIDERPAAGQNGNAADGQAERCYLPNFLILQIAVVAIEAAECGQPELLTEKFSRQELELAKYWLWVWHIGTATLPTSKAFYKLFAELVGF